MDTKAEPDAFLQALPRAEDLPAAVRDLHCQPGHFAGRCSITRGKGGLVALALRVGGFPHAADDIPVTLTTRLNGRHRRWHRDFGGHQTRSCLRYDPARGLVQEDIGGLSIWMRPYLSGDRLFLEIRRMTLLGIPCPKVLLPRSSSVEWQDESGRFRFDISAELPGLGQLIRYHGWLTRDHDQLKDV